MYGQGISSEHYVCFGGIALPSAQWSRPLIIIDRERRIKHIERDEGNEGGMGSHPEMPPIEVGPRRSSIHYSLSRCSFVPIFHRLEAQEARMFKPLDHH
jgi:hypothetical protein